MKLLDLTLPLPEENLAIDEALLDELASTDGDQSSTSSRASEESKPKELKPQELKPQEKTPRIDSKTNSGIECSLGNLAQESTGKSAHPTEAFHEPFLRQETLRLWEPQQTMVVIGRSSRINDEVDLEFCAANDIPVLRRCSGGLSIVTGPGCLMYAVVLDLRLQPELRALDAAHCFVLRRIRDALNAAGGDVTIQGTSDLTLGDRKFSGNSLRLTKDALLYHGTLLNQFDLDLISRCLKTPHRQPNYRQQRSHKDFLRNLELKSDMIRNEIIKSWEANEPTVDWPKTRMKNLIDEKYSRREWNHRI